MPACGRARAERLWAAPFVRPVPQDANSAFGTRSIFNGKPRNAHGGADFLSPAGTPIHVAQRRPRRRRAQSLFLGEHRDHRPRPGTVLDAGAPVGDRRARRRSRHGRQLLGRVGATGRVTGPHLHWAVRASDARVDPLSLLACSAHLRWMIRSARDWMSFRFRHRKALYAQLLRNRADTDVVPTCERRFHLWPFALPKRACSDGRSGASDAVVCELGLNNDDSAYELRLNPPWNLQSTPRSFDDAMQAFQRHAAIERVLIDEGWLLEGFESVIGSTLAQLPRRLMTCVTSSRGCSECPSR